MAKVLIVDDSSSMRQMVSFTLKRAGHEISEAEDGVQALKVAQADRFDLVITDMNMPNMNGLEFTKQLRASTAYKFTPILVLTTEASPELKQQGRAAGATGWLVKPFDPNKLSATVEKVLA